MMSSFIIEYSANGKSYFKSNVFTRYLKIFSKV